MIRKKCRAGRIVWWLAGILALATSGVGAERDSGPPATSGAATAGATVASPEEIARLKALLAAQQAQIEQLRVALEQQQKLLERTAVQIEPGRAPSLGQVASTTPIIPSGTVVPTLPPPAMPASATGQAAMARPNPSPLTFHIGTASLTPVGFMDMTLVYRDKANGGGIGSNFGSIPFVNTPSGQLSEFRFSAQNSRIGMRVDAKVSGANVLGYWESDFLGFSPTNAAVSSNSNAFRMRLYWINVRKGKWEIQGGQSWSLLTPNRRGLSALPADLFYSQVIDVNYMLGLTWSRNPGFRAIYHPTPTVAMGLSLEAAEQYGGGSAGGSSIVLPTALAANAGFIGQYNNGTTTFGVPNLVPDVIAKIAFDPRIPGHSLHFEVAGLTSTVKFYNPLNNQKYTATGGGGSANVNFELVKNFRVVANTYFSDGGGRWVFGQAPDMVIRGDGSPSLVHSYSTVSGFEYQPNPNTFLYAYYGGLYIGKNAVIDPANGRPVGYGYTGSPNSQNRSAQEPAFGFSQTFWKNPSYGALALMGQYSYFTRNPWYVVTGQPKNAHLNMVMLNLRYTLPGAPPAVE